MNRFTQVNIKKPYLVFVGDVESPTYVKTAAGLVQWRPQDIAGQLKFSGNPLELGVPNLNIEEAILAGAKSLVIGVAPVGGVIGAEWIEVLRKAAEAGLDVVSGLHRRLNSYPELVLAAEKSGAKLIDVRVPSQDLPIANGVRRTGKRLLMVGSDCAVGKKYTALAISQMLNKHGIEATFRATGQTGIMIAGSGVPIDAVVADFIAGAAEIISPQNHNNHWDVIEGQGSLFNPSYSGVSLGLLHGSQPDAIIVCHDPLRKMMSSCPHLPIPSVEECIELSLSCGRIVNPEIQCIGISINSVAMSAKDAENYKNKITQQTGYPCFDPLVDGCEIIIEKIRGLSFETTS